MKCEREFANDRMLIKPMSFRTVKISELKALLWSDASLTSISWSNGNKNLRLVVSLSDGRAAIFDFCWADRLRVDLKYSEGENYPPTVWAVDFGTGRAARHSVLFDFASHGSIALEFESVNVDGI